MLPRMQDRVRVLLAAVGEDPEREGLKDTPKVSAVRAGLADGWGRRRTKRQESNRSTPTHCWCVRAVPLQPASQLKQRVAKAFLDMMAGYKVPLER